MTLRPRLGRILLSTLLCATPLAAADELLPNPEFDEASTTGWLGDIASLSWSPDDAECLPPFASGSLLLSPEDPNGAATAVYCVDAPISGTLNFTFLVRTDCEETVTGLLRYHPGVDCSGAPLGTGFVSAAIPGGTWEEGGVFDSAVPAGTEWIWIAVQVSPSVSQNCNARFDKIHLGSGLVIQRSGFETGSTDCRWVELP